MTYVRVTQAGAYVEQEGASIRTTQSGALVEYAGKSVRMTQAGAYVEYQEVVYGSALDASLVAFLGLQAGKQAAFGTSVPVTFAMPFQAAYVDGQEEHIAQWDTGVWTPVVIVERLASFATFTLSGTMFFELLPVFLNAGFGELTASGSGPYVYDGSITPATVGTPSPYTFLFGGNDANRVQNSAIQIQDAHLQSLSLSFNMNTKEVSFTSEWFGSYVDDNDGTGYEMAAVNLPDSIQMMRGLLSTLEIQDATTTGGDFLTMTGFDCSVIDWTLEIDTGLRAAWSKDKNQLVYCGVRHEEPSLTFSPVIRTDAFHYALTKVKANLRQFQELQLTLNGETSSQVILQMTGRWQPNFTGQSRNASEVVMQPTFEAATPATQTTTPHWLSWELDTQWEH